MIDEIVPEPLGGAHRDRKQTAENLKAALKRHLEELLREPIDALLEQRYNRLVSYGIYEEVTA